MGRNIPGLITALIISLCALTLLPSVHSVSAGTSWTFTLTPKCPVASDVPLYPVYPMYAFWPPTATSNTLNWMYGAQTKSTSTISMTTVNTGIHSGYVALYSTNGTVIPGESSVPATSLIFPTWSGWNPPTKMIKFDAQNLANGNYNFNYAMPAGTCGTPGYTLALSVPGGTYFEGRTITINWALTYINQPVDPSSPYTTTVKILRPNNVTSGTTATLGTFNMIAGSSGSLTYTIPFTLQPANDYVINFDASGPALHSGPASSSHLLASSNAVNVVIPPPTNFKGVCTGTTGTFTWTPPAGISNFYWRLLDLTTNAYIGNEELGMANVTGSSFTHNSMIPGHNYRAWMHSKVPISIIPNWSDTVYSEFSCPAPSPTPTATPTPTPTVTPTPAGYCTTAANCTDGKVCVNNGCQVPSPTPTQTPTPTLTPVVSPTPNCSLRKHGDADCNCIIDSADYTIWRKEFLNEVPQERADFSSKAECKNTDGSTNYVCTFDLDIWRDGMTRGLACDNTNPTSGPTATAIPASTIMPSATSIPIQPTVPPQSTRTPTPVPPTATPPALPPLLDSNYLAVRTKFTTDEASNLSSTSANNVTVVSTTQTSWNNGCMGCGGGMCPSVIVTGYSVVVSGASATEPGKCIYRAYNFKSNATTMCAATGGRVVAACGTNPIPTPVPMSSTQ